MSMCGIQDPKKVSQLLVQMFLSDQREVRETTFKTVRPSKFRVKPAVAASSALISSFPGLKLENGKGIVRGCSQAESSPRHPKVHNIDPQTSKHVQMHQKCEATRTFLRTSTGL